MGAYSLLLGFIYGFMMFKTVFACFVYVVIYVYRSYAASLQVHISFHMCYVDCRFDIGVDM